MQYCICNLAVFLRTLNPVTALLELSFCRSVQGKRLASQSLSQEGTFGGILPRQLKVNLSLNPAGIAYCWDVALEEVQPQTCIRTPRVSKLSPNSAAIPKIQCSASSTLPMQVRPFVECMH